MADKDKRREKATEAVTECSAADHHPIHQGNHHAKFTDSPMKSDPEKSCFQRVDKDQRNILLK